LAVVASRSAFQQTTQSHAARLRYGVPLHSGGVTVDEVAVDFGTIKAASLSRRLIRSSRPLPVIAAW
jgi:hypothetical protein